MAKERQAWPLPPALSGSDATACAKLPPQGQVDSPAMQGQPVDALIACGRDGARSTRRTPAGTARQGSAVPPRGYDDLQLSADIENGAGERPGCLAGGAGTAGGCGRRQTAGRSVQHRARFGTGGLRGDWVDRRGPRLSADELATLYKTDRSSWIVQGWVVTDPEVLAHMGIPEGETCVEIPDRMIPFFAEGD